MTAEQTYPAWMREFLLQNFVSLFAGGIRRVLKDLIKK